MTLAGKVVVVTRAPEAEGRFRSLLEEAGAEVLSVPTIAIVPISDQGSIDSAIAGLKQGAFDWVAFTSVNGVDHFLSRIDGAPSDAFARVKVAAVGQRTSRALSEARIAVDLMPERFTAEAMADALGDGPGRVLLPRAAVVPPIMTQTLSARGWEVDEVAVYRTIPATPTGPEAERVRTGSYDIVTFTSASTVRGFAGCFGPEAARDKLVACIGPVTAAACSEVGIAVTTVADEHTTDGLVATLVEQVGR